MFRGIIRKAVNHLQWKILGDNVLLRKLTGRKGFGIKRSKILGTLLYVFPVRNMLRFSAGSKGYYHEIHKLLHISKHEGHKLVRIGNQYDGGYIMLDDLSGGIAYSFGIFNDASWDKDMASRGYDVFMYDHTIEKLPEYNPRFHFFRQGIADGVTQDDRLKTLEELIAQNHHEDKQNMILKMDVEGAEWGFFEHIDEKILSQFSQIVFEIHGLNGEFHGIGIPDFERRIPKVLEKINRTHKLFHIHGLNNGYYISLGSKIFCNQIEVSYALRSKYDFVEDYDVNLPLDVDMPCHENVPDVILGHWNNAVRPEDAFTSITIL